MLSLYSRLVWICRNMNLSGKIFEIKWGTVRYISGHLVVNNVFYNIGMTYIYYIILSCAPITAHVTFITAANNHVIVKPRVWGK